MVSLRVGCHTNLTRPLCHTTVTRIHCGKTLPSESRTLVEVDEVILTTLESLQHFVLALVGDMRNINSCATWEVDMRVSAFNDGTTFAVDFLEFVKDTTTRLQVSEVVTKVNGTEAGIK